MEDIAATADQIIAQIPPLPTLIQQYGDGFASTHWQTPKDSVLHTSFTQNYQEPEWRFLERCECYWRRGISAQLVRAMKLPKEEERALIRACWLTLKRPSELPLWPEFDYGERPRPDHGDRGKWDVGAHQIP